MQTDIRANRSATKWTRFELVGRIAWCSVAPIFKLTPRFAWPLRRSILRLFGARVDPTARIEPSAIIEIPWNLAIGPYSSIGRRAIVYNLGLITIGARVTVSQGVHLCAGTHDYRSPAFDLVKETIEVEDDAWLCADSFVRGGLRVGRGSILAARSCAHKDIEAWSIIGGNPGCQIGVRSQRAL